MLLVPIRISTFLFYLLQPQVEHFNFASDSILMTRPSDDDAIWMLSDNSAANNSNACQNYMMATKKFIRSSFITNLKCAHITNYGTKCWCSKCAKERLKFKPRTDLLFLSSDLLNDFFRQYEILEWKSESLTNSYLPSFETLHPSICNNLAPEIANSAKDFKILVNSSTSQSAVATTAEKAPQVTSPSSSHVVNVKNSSNIPKSMAGHTILKNLERPASRRYSVSENLLHTNSKMCIEDNVKNFTSRSISMIDKITCSNSSSLSSNSITTNKLNIKSTNSTINQTNSDKTSSKFISTVLENAHPGNTSIKTNTFCKRKFSNVKKSRQKAIEIFKISNVKSKSPNSHPKLKKTTKLFVNKNATKGLKMTISSTSPSVDHSSKVALNEPLTVLDNGAVPTKVSTKIRARYEKDLSRQRKEQHQKIKYCGSPTSSRISPGTQYDRHKIARKRSKKALKGSKQKVHCLSQDIETEREDLAKGLKPNSNIQYPIPIINEPIITPNLLRAKQNIMIYLSDMCRSYECFGSFIKLPAKEKQQIFENNGIDLNKYLSVSITKETKRAAIKELSKHNRINGLITGPREISEGVPVGESSLRGNERRNSSGSDSGVDLSVEGLIVATKPPPPTREIITCNLCNEKEEYMSDEQLWQHQSSKHLGKDCTKDNVFPASDKRIVEYTTCELNAGPDLCKYEQDEMAKQEKQSHQPVWVCFECNPPSMLLEDKFNSHAEDFLHFEDVMHFKSHTDAAAEMRRKRPSV